MRLNNIVLKPLISEKGVKLQDLHKYCFKVVRQATKADIRAEMKRLFSVDVVDVNMCVVPGKKKRVPRTRWFTKAANWKKAFVTLKEGQKIDLFSVNKE